MNVRATGWPEVAVPVSTQQPNHETIPLPPGPSNQPHHSNTESIATDDGELEYLIPYPMRRRPHGLCLIINNKTFVGNHRHGSQYDESALSQLFSTLGYQLYKGKIHRNCSAEEIKYLLKVVADSDHSQHDSVVVFIGSHGQKVQDRDEILGVDKETVSIDEIQSFFVNCESLLGKPKIFFIEICRGEQQLPEGRRVELDGDVDEPSFMLIPRDSDLFFGYATTPNTKAIRSMKTGSWYVMKLCTILQEHYKNMDLLSMVTAVHHQVTANHQHTFKKSETTYGTYKQSPQLVSTLTRPVYFDRY